MSKTITGYEVRYTVEVDRPERRNASFAPVKPGTRVYSVQRCRTQAEAVRFYNALVNGEDDFESEFVSRVEALRMYTGRSPAYVRRRVERDSRDHAWVDPFKRSER